MPRTKYDGVYKGDDGIYWAYHNGKKKCANRLSVAWDVYHKLKDEMDRGAIEARAAERAPLQGLEVIILRGVPGCGKTTWAKQYIADNPWYKRISRDCLREMLDFGEYSSDNERFIRDMRRRLIRDCLQEGSCLIIDDTNLKDRDIHDIRGAARRYNHVIGIERIEPVPTRIVEFDTPLAVCIERDAQRAKPVGADRITVMWYEIHPFDSDEEIDAYRAAKRRLKVS